MLQLYNKDHVKIEGLTRYKDLCIESDLSKGDKILSFSYPKKLSENICLEGYIRTKTDEYVIKEINRNRSNMEVKCNLNLESLEGQSWDRFESVEQTVSSCLNLALAGTGWSVGTCSIDKLRTIRKTACNSLDIIQEIIGTYICEVEFNSLTKTINIANTLGSDKGVYFIENLNLLDLSIQGNSYDYYTKIDARGKDDLAVILENHQYSNKVKTIYWKDERYTDITSLTEDATYKLNEMSKPYTAYKATVLDLANASDIYKNILAYKLGDIITLVSKNHKTREKQRIVKMTQYPEDPTKNTCELGSTILKFEDVQKQQKDTTETVNNITSDNGTISEEAIQTTVEKITINKADIQSLNAVNIRVGDLEATRATITNLDATNVVVENLKAQKANIADLDAGVARIHILEANTADIKTLLAGNVTAGSTQTIVLNANNTTIANALIKSAMIESLDVSKILAGTINTNKFTITSNDGAILITDNTMQFKDSNGNVRIQLGQDTSNNFNFIVKAADGTTTIIDGYGVKEKAIADGLIKTNMVADNSIKASKIDYASFVTGYNASTNTSTITGSKVTIDGQNLNVLFNTLQTNVNSKLGRNIILNSNFENGMTTWNFGGGLDTVATAYSQGDGTYGQVCCLNRVSGSNYVLLENAKLATPLKNNTTYTLTFMAKADGSAKTITIDVAKGGTNKCFSTVTKNIGITWQQVKIVFTNTTGYTDQVVQIYLNSSGIIYFTNFKLEEGNDSTDYCKATEDVDTKIKTNTTSITAVQGQISTLITETAQITDIKNNVNTLQSNYSTINQTVNSINTTVSSHTSSISGLQTSITSANSSISQLSNRIDLKVSTSSYNADFQRLISNINNSTSVVNIVKNGNFANGDNNWLYYNGLTKYLVINGVIYIQNKSTSAGTFYQEITLDKSTTYVLSFSLEQQVNVTGCEAIIEYVDNTGHVIQDYYIPNVVKDGIIHQYTFTTRNDFTSVRLIFIHKGPTSATQAHLICVGSVVLVKTVNINETIASVEQKITSSAITTTISTGINNGTSSISTTNFIMDNTGLTIKNGGIKVLNSNSITVMRVTASGDLSIRGDLENYDSSGILRASLRDTKVHFYNESGNYLGGLGANNYVNDNSIKGLTLDLDYAGKYISFAKKNDGGSGYTPVFAYHKSGSFATEGLHAGCDFNMENYTLRNVKLESVSSGGYSSFTGDVSYVRSITPGSGGTISWVSSTLKIRNGIIIGT